MENFCKAVVRELQKKSSDTQCEYKAVKKVNSVERHGISIHRENESISPVFYVSPEDMGKWTPEEFADVLWDRYLYEMANTPEFNIASFEDPEYIKKHVIFDIVNRKLNEDEYVNVPLNDELTVVFKICVDNNGFIRLRNSQLSIWDGEITPDILMECAKENSAIIDKVSFKPLEMVLIDMFLPKMKDDMPELSEDELKELAKLRLGGGGLPLYVLTTESFGSNASLLYAGVKEQIRSELNDDVIVIPSSTHELLVLGKEKALEIGLDELREMTKTVNRDVVIASDETDFLSDQIFIIDGDGIREATYQDFNMEESR